METPVMSIGEAAEKTVAESFPEKKEEPVKEKRRVVVLACSSVSDLNELEELLNGGYKIKHSQEFAMTYEEDEPEGTIVYVLELEESEQIASVVSVELNQVDPYLAQGYIVHELFAKTATLIKKAKP